MNGAQQASLPTTARGASGWRGASMRLLRMFPGWRLWRFYPALLFCVLAVLGWECMARVLHSALVPDVGTIAGEISRILTSGEAFTQIGITLWRIVLGFAAAFIVSVLIGIACARRPAVRIFFEPAIVLGLTVPGLVWTLLCVIWFGVSLATPVVAIALGIAPTLILTVIQGVNSVDPDIMEMARAYRLRRVDVFRRIWWPSLIPFLFSGARIGFSLAWKVIVLVEIFGLSDGVGYKLNSEFSLQNVEGVMAWTIVFWLAMSVLEYGVFQNAERALSQWRREART
ncbi:MAG: ABC transporter permease subunit [Azoarcus sp.]|jgi:NitT/TauT family transport system permease protein|nr:ABC transporter permease subunit [Azoarcus sp.]